MSVEEVIEEMIEVRRQKVASDEKYIDMAIEKYAPDAERIERASAFFVGRVREWQKEIALLENVLNRSN